MRYIFALILSIMLLGCGTTKPPTNTQIVEVLVPTKCTPTVKITEITEDPTSRITKDMTLFEKAQLTLSELFLYKGQNKELKAALSECTR